MFKAFQNGYEFPDYVDYEMWDYTRNHKDENKALTGFIGFGCSFGGRFFQGYARNGEKRKNCAEETKSTLNKIKSQIEKITFTNQDYRDIILPDGCVVYCDPPYNGTKQYAYMGKFDTENFWENMRKMSKKHVIFVSEQHSPHDFVQIWSRNKTRVLSYDKDKYFTATEHLYVHESYADMFREQIKKDIEYNKLNTGNNI